MCVRIYSQIIFGGNRFILLPQSRHAQIRSAVIDCTKRLIRQEVVYRQEVLWETFNTKEVRMMRPLTLIPSHDSHRDQLQDQCSPAQRKRADSLIFSITSQKNTNSPKETLLIDCPQDLVNRQLETLQLKLDSLQNKVQNITSERFVVCETQQNSDPCNESSIANKAKQFTQRQKENLDVSNRVGKIVRKHKDLAKTSQIVKLNTSKNRNETFAACSRNSLLSDQSFVQKQRELHRLKKEASVMRQFLERTERSKSLCSEKLSASKSVIKSLKKEERKHERQVGKLKADLKRSELIREKQKQLIVKQQEQIASLRSHLRLSKHSR